MVGMSIAAVGILYAADAQGATADNTPKELGADPNTGEMVTLRKGPYGWYVQLGEAAKPKRVSLYRGLEPADMDLNLGLKLLELPRPVGLHPETQKPISAGVGRFGPYLLHNGVYKSLPKDDDVLTIGINRAVDLLAQARTKKGAEPLRTLGDHDGKPVTVHEGRYGPYVSRDGVHATLPKDTDPLTVTLEQALPLIAAKAEKMPAKPAKKASAAKKVPAAKKASAAKKAPAEKKVAAEKKAPVAKKPATKKPAAKKPAAKAKVVAE